MTIRAHSPLIAVKTAEELIATLPDQLKGSRNEQKYIVVSWAQMLRGQLGLPTEGYEAKSIMSSCYPAATGGEDTGGSRDESVVVTASGGARTIASTGSGLDPYRQVVSARELIVKSCYAIFFL